MSIIVEYFIAPDDATAADVLVGGPEDVFPTMSCGNFFADAAAAEWEAILLGRVAGEFEAAGGPRVVAEAGSDSLAMVFAVSSRLQTALGGANRDALTAVARRWIQEYGGNYPSFEPDTACEILWELADLARSANDQRQVLYCWMC